MLKKIFILVAFFAICTFGFVFMSKEDSSAQATCSIENRRGCCSHHGGVCGCRNGRAVCCDNTLSPSCGCD